MAKHRKKKQRDAERSATEPKAAPTPSSRGPVLKRRGLPNWPVLAPALLGMALTGYLAATSWLGAPPAFCGEGSGCDIVQSSRWGHLLGLPTAAWGFLAYAALGHVAFRVRNPQRHWQLVWLISLLALAVSVYLTAVALWQLQATCLYCLLSLGLFALLFVVALLQRPAGLPDFSWPVWGGQTAGFAVVAIVLLHLHFSGFLTPSAGPEDPYLRGLAEHLTRTGAVFYGAYW